MSNDSADIVVRAVRQYRPDDDDAWAAFDAALLGDPERAVAAATPFVTSADPAERGAAAMIIGEVVSLCLPHAGRTSSDLLLEQLLVETDSRAREDISTGLGKIWNAEATRETVLALVRHPNANARYAAAQNLALCTTDRPDDASRQQRSALELLKSDPDEEVRSWAVLGLETLSVD